MDHYETGDLVEIVSKPTKCCKEGAECKVVGLGRYVEPKSPMSSDPRWTHAIDIDRVLCDGKKGTCAWFMNCDIKHAVTHI